MMMRTTGLVLVCAAACGPGGRSGDGMGSGSGSGSGSGNTTQQPTTCEAAQQNALSVGCDYYTVDMDAASGPPNNACYAVYVANVSQMPVHVQATWNGTTIDLSQYAKLPQGTGQSLTYGAYDATAGIAPGGVAILFLAYTFTLGNVACPVPAAIQTVGPQINGTGMGHAFHITTDEPVVAYQILPYGGGDAAATGASLLLPTSAWGTNYVAVSAYDTSSPPIPIPMGPSHNFVAMEDDTTVTIRPTSAIAAGGGLPAGAANAPYTITIAHAGDYAQITQLAPLSGSPVNSDKPIGEFGGHQIMSIDRCCGDHGEQMLAPVQALGSSYVAAPHGDRLAAPGEPRVFRIYGAVDGTQLTYDPSNVPGPSTIGQGGMAEIRTTSPFTVSSQDSSHPFTLFTYMTGGGVTDPTDMGYDPMYPGGVGDPDFVRVVPPPQYLSHYVFFTDPTYPFTTLTVTRQKQMDGTFADVKLDCAGTLTNWQPVGGNGDYEITYVKMVDHWNSQNGCNNGVHVMDSAAGFGVWVWGWGSDDTNTGWVSYGYPAGEQVQAINNVIIQ